MYCNESKDAICEYNKGLEIFSIDMTLMYPNSNEKQIDKIIPKVNIALKKTSTLN